MKSIRFIYIGIVTVLSCALLFPSCKEEDKVLRSDEYFVYFDGESSVGVEGETIEVPITLASALNSNAVTVTLALEDSTSVATDYQLVGDGTVTFAPNELIAYASVTLSDNTILCEANKFVKLKIVSVSDPNIYPGFPYSGNKSSHLISIQDNDIAVLEDISGSYSVVSSGGAGDGAGGLQVIDPFPWDYTVNISPVGGTNRYVIDDITMGLYPIGYGASGPNPGTFDYVSTSGQITIDQIASPDVIYGSDAFFGTGSTSLDCDGNLEFITIDWSNGWGDTGVSTLTGL